jgi:hypothetical protein
MEPREIAARSLAESVARLDPVLHPWGFTFEHDGCHSSHTGPYASGHYVRDTTRIGLSCRETIDNLVYEHSFITERSSWCEIERFTIGHNGLMNALGHSAHCHLIGSDNIPDAIVARDGGDRVAALIHDLSSFVAPILRGPSDKFFEIIRHGTRYFSVT